MVVGQCLAGVVLRRATGHDLAVVLVVGVGLSVFQDGGTILHGDCVLVFQVASLERYPFVAVLGNQIRQVPRRRAILAQPTRL